MFVRQSGALGLMAALVYGLGVAVHAAVHLAGGGDSFAWTSPAHVLMAVTALGALAVAAGWLAGNLPDRRRRFGLLRARAAFRPVAATLTGGAGVAAIAVVLVAAEGASLDPARLGEAILSGAVALAIALAVLFVAPRTVLAIAAALVAPRERKAGRLHRVAVPPTRVLALASALARAGALRAPPLPLVA